MRATLEVILSAKLFELIYIQKISISKDERDPTMCQLIILSKRAVVYFGTCGAL
jgi:hypothetical protein